MNMKKLSILAACALVLSCLLVACTQAPSDPTQSDEAPAQTTAQTTAQQTDDRPDGQTDDLIMDAPDIQSPVLSPDENGKITYTVTVVDQNGDPVIGAAVQMCADLACLLPTPTNADGVAAFTIEPAETCYVTVISCPEGYTVDTTQSFHFPEGSAELTVTVNKE